MKRALTVMTLLAGAASVYSQGQIGLSGYGNPNFSIQIFNTQSSAVTPVTYGTSSGTETQGSSANANMLVPGTTVYDAGSALGTGYSVQLLGAAGAGDSLSSLTPQGPVITTWYTTAGGDPTTGLNGFYNSVANATIVGALAGSSATVALAAWNNEGGTIGSLAAAQAAGDPWGVSVTGNTAPLGGGIGTPPNLPTAITSFSLATTVPEPSTIALGIIGASTFLMRLRRKQ